MEVEMKKKLKKALIVFLVVSVVMFSFWNINFKGMQKQACIMNNELGSNLTYPIRLPLPPYDLYVGCDMYKIEKAWYLR